MLTSFEYVIFLEMHQTSVGPALSYSLTLEQDRKTEPFRALLGMVLVQLGEVDVEGPDLDEAVRKYEQMKRPSGGPSGGSGTGPSDGSGGGSGGWNDIQPDWPTKLERNPDSTSGKGKKRSNSRQGGRASGSKKRVRRPHAVTNNAGPIIPARLTRSVSRQLMTSKMDKGSTPAIVRFPPPSHYVVQIYL